MGIFNLFKKKKSYPPFDFSTLKTDIHSHLIPGIDDGSKSLEESMIILREFQALGYKKIITTPHIMSDYYKNTPEIILSGLEKLKSQIQKENLNIEIEAAAEYYLDEFFIQKIKEKNILSFGGNYVLFELPFIAEPQLLSEAVFELQLAGFKPILAHPERYSYWHKNFVSKMEELKSKSVYLQLNLLSLTGHYAPEVRKIAETMVTNRLVDFVGSDCHKIEHLHILKNQSATKGFYELAQLQLRNTTL